MPDRIKAHKMPDVFETANKISRPSQFLRSRGAMVEINAGKKIPASFRVGVQASACSDEECRLNKLKLELQQFGQLLKY
jgi:hypothetical protein